MARSLAAMVSWVSSWGARRGVEAELLQHLGDLSVDVVAGLGAGRQGGDAAAGVVLGQDAADDRPAAVADAGEHDLRCVGGGSSDTSADWVMSAPGGGLGFLAGVVLVGDDDVVSALTDVRVKPQDEADGYGGADDLGADEPRDGPGSDAGEGVGEDPADGDGGVGERRREVNQYAAPM